MKRHAYLIKAHHQFDLLEKLLRLLDDERNDIYIHIGVGVDYERAKFEKCVKKSGIFFVDPVKESWGGYSQIESELHLFEVAAENSYAYYHLLSGVDLPLKTQDEIHAFFEANEGKEFIYFCPKSFWKESAYKYEQYRFFQEKVGRKQSGVYFFMEKISLFLQRRFGIRRQQPEMEYCLGANWVSITHSLIKYIIEQKNLIRKLFEKTLCCDEFFVQTLVWNSKYRENVYSFEDDYFACLRLIDWKRGNPYVWRNQDYEELMNAPHLFARKFDENVDREVIDRIFQTISDRQKTGKENS